MEASRDFTDQVPIVSGQETLSAEYVGGALVAIEQSRAVQEVQAAMIVAKRFPRDEIRASKRILEACKRPTLAKAAQYAYPRGGATVSGPSIRLAEVCARYWGNLNCGIRELSQEFGRSEMEAFCHDLETNTRESRVFQVRHQRYRRLDKGGPVDLDDPRDIYEMVANQGARRLRACILAVIPGDIIEEAMSQCDKTLAGDKSEPLIDRTKRMVAAFEEVGVSLDQIEQRIGKRLDAILETELVNLRKVYQSLRDGMSTARDWFKTGPEPSQDAPGSTNPPDPGAEAGTDHEMTEKEREAALDAALWMARDDGLVDEDGYPLVEAVKSHLPAGMRVWAKTMHTRWDIIKPVPGQQQQTTPPPPSPEPGAAETQAQARFERIKGAIRAHAEELAAYHLDPTKPNPGPQGAYIRRVVKDAMDVEIRKADQDVAEEMRHEGD